MNAETMMFAAVAANRLRSRLSFAGMPIHVPSPADRLRRRRSAAGRTETKTGLRWVLGAIGPGVISGAADDDPSGIATYSIAGAQLGTAMLWTALFTWPLMAVVQFMCARVGMVSGGGLTRALKRKFPRWLVLATGAALIIANTINIGADLGGMADAAVVLVGGNQLGFTALFAVAIGAATVWLSYRRIAALLKWLALALGGYAVAAFLTHPDWSRVARDVFVAHWPRDKSEWSTLVALLGTTISPYLFFWQSSQEVEEEKCEGRTTIPKRSGATPGEIRRRQLDVGMGTLFSNLVMFFVILSCAQSLHRNGVTEIESAKDAALALRPFAGAFATTLYTLGILGLGMLAIPTLAGSSAYVVAETFNWRQGLNEKFQPARKFYAIVLVSIAAGAALNLLRINPVKALYWTAIVNGVLAPIILVGLLAVARDRHLMNGQASSRFSLIAVGFTTLVMAGAGVAMFVL